MALHYSVLPPLMLDTRVPVGLHWGSQFSLAAIKTPTVHLPRKKKVHRRRNKCFASMSILVRHIKSKGIEGPLDNPPFFPPLSIESRGVQPPLDNGAFPAERVFKCRQSQL